MRKKVNEEVSAYMARMGKKGGKAKNAAKGFGSWTAEQRSTAARKGAKTRWAKVRKAAAAAKKAAKK